MKTGFASVNRILVCLGILFLSFPMFGQTSQPRDLSEMTPEKIREEIERIVEATPAESVGEAEYESNSPDRRTAVESRLTAFRTEARQLLSARRWGLAHKRFELLVRWGGREEDAAAGALCLNEMRRHDEALKLLDQIDPSGSGRKFRRERAIALAGLKRNVEARRIMPELDLNDPRGAFHRGHLDIVEEEWDSAIRAFVFAAKDARYAKQSKFFVAQISAAKESGRQPEGLQALSQFVLLPETKRLRVAPDSGAFVGADGGKRWRVRLSVAGEHNSNVLAAPDGQPLPANIANDDDFSLNFRVAGEYDLLRSDEWRVSGGMSYFHRLHEDLSAFDFQRFQPGLRATRARGKWQWQSGFGLDLDWLDSDDFARNYNFSQTIGYRHGPRSQTSAGYHLSYRDFLNAPAATAEDRTGDYHRVSVAHTLAFPRTRTMVTGGLRLERQNTQGSSFDAMGYGIDMFARQALPYRLTLEGQFNFSFRDHSELNFRAPTREREDLAWSLGVQLSRPVAKHATAFVGYTRVENDSNISAVFDFAQNIFSAGLRLDF